MVGMEGQGHGGLQPRDPSSLRISDDDRHRVAEVLRQAAGEGRIDLEELDERLEATYGAKTYGDLVPITADLPAQGTAHHPTTPRPAHAQPSPVPATRHESSFSVMGDCTRRGVWEVPARHNAFALMGSVTLDLREARFTARETVIEAYAVMAGIEVIVNAHTQVVVEGIGIMGAFNEARSRVSPEIVPDSPVVRIKGLALMAGVDVKRKPMPGSTKNRRGLPNR
jgi:hypothetical protein